MKSSAILLFFLLLTLSSVKGQFDIRGIVIDDTNQPIPGANISLHELHRHTSTSLKGTFAIKNLKPSSYHLHVSAVGFHGKALTIWLKSDTTIRIMLHESVNELHEVVVEGNVLKEDQKESSLLVRVVDEEQINESLSSSLMESLGKLEGVTSMNIGVGASKPVIRGMNSYRVLVNDNGIRQEGQQWGTDHGLEIDQQSVGQLEVLKGPAALSYGSGAMGGVINIKDAHVVEQGETELKVKSVYRSLNDTRGLVVGMGGNRNGFVFALNGTYMDYSNYKVPTNQYVYFTQVLDLFENELSNTAGKERHFKSMIGLHRSWGHTHLTVSRFGQRVGVFAGAVGIARSYEISDPDAFDIDVPFQLVDHWKVLSNSNIAWGNGWLELDVGYQSNQREEHERGGNHGIPSTGTTLGLDLDLKSIEGNVKYHFPKGKKGAGVLGAQFNYITNRVGGFDFIIPGYTRTQGALYYIHKWKPSELLSLNAGMRIDGITFQSNSHVRPFFRDFEFIGFVRRSPDLDEEYLNYSAGIGGAYQYSDQINLKFNFGKTFRAPSIAELASNGVHHGLFRFEKGDSTLKAEQGYQFDVGMIYEGKRIHYSFSPYVNYYTNFIYLGASNQFATVDIDGISIPFPGGGQVYQYQQTEALFTGFEVNIHYHLSKQLELDLVGDYVRANNLNSIWDLPFIPPWSLNLSTRYTLNEKLKWLNDTWLKVGLGIYGAQNKVDQNEATTAGYFLLDLSGGCHFGQKENWGLTFQIVNLLDGSYLNHLSRYRILAIPEPGRNITVTLSYKI